MYRTSKSPKENIWIFPIYFLLLLFVLLNEKNSNSYIRVNTKGLCLCISPIKAFRDSMSRYVLYIVFFFFWAIISVLTTPLFSSPANAPVKDSATSTEKCQTVGKKSNCSSQPQSGGKTGCLLWKFRTIPGYSPMSFICGQSGRMSYLFFPAHLSPLLSNFPFFSLASILNKTRTWVVIIVPSSQEVSGLERDRNHLQDSPSPVCRVLWEDLRGSKRLLRRKIFFQAAYQGA